MIAAGFILLLQMSVRVFLPLKLSLFVLEILKVRPLQEIANLDANLFKTHFQKAQEENIKAFSKKS